MTTERFYADLPAFTDFAEFSDLSAYKPLPADWTVFVSDVVNSTQAIQAGRYKAVNMAGAATIMAALNAADGADLPYVFGGDGAIVAMPNTLAEAGREALARVAGLSETAYGLTLRVSEFPMTMLETAGHPFLVRKFALGESARLAMFAGDGVAYVEGLLKDDAIGMAFRIEPSFADADVSGLTCRWEPLTPTHGLMLTVMAADQDSTRPSLAELRARFHAILGGDETSAAPVSNGSLKFRWPPRGLRLEALALAGKKAFWKSYLPIFLESVAQLYAERFRKRAGPYDAPKYRDELIAQTDFRKFDGMLRLTLDITPAQADAIEATLAEMHADKRIVYGVHRADAALMTCLVFDLAASDHVHFIDGADGGFAIAAQQFKAQLEAAA